MSECDVAHTLGDCTESGHVGILYNVRDEPPEWPNRPFLTSTELAAIAKVAERTIHREISRSHLQGFKLGRQWVVDRGEAQRWLAEYNQGRTR